MACVSSIPLIEVTLSGEEEYEYDYHETIEIPKSNATLFQDTREMQNNTSYTFIQGNTLVSRFFDNSYLGYASPSILEYRSSIVYCPMCGRRLID